MARALGTERCSCGAVIEVDITCVTAYSILGTRLNEFREAHASCREQDTKSAPTSDRDVGSDDVRT